MKNEKQGFEVGDKVTVYNRYLFAIPAIGVVYKIASKDGALSIIFDSNQSVNATKHNNCYFFQEECRLFVDQQKTKTKKNKGMTIQDFEKLNHGALVEINSHNDRDKIRKFLGIVNGNIVTCKTDGSLPCNWDHREFKSFSIYEPPKQKVKFYLYSKGCDEEGKCSSSFYSDNFKSKWHGGRIVDTVGSPLKTFWKKTNTFIEVEI